MAVQGGSEITSTISEVLRTYVCKWTIHSFSLISLEESYSSEILDHAHESLKWKIRRTRESGNEFIVFKLVCKSSKTGAQADRVNFTGDIRNSNGDVIREMGDDSWYEVSTPESSESLELLKVQAHRLLPKLEDDTLSIHLKASYVLPEERGNLSGRHAKLIQDFGTLYKTENMTDAVVVVQETEIKVHSVVLAARSKVLATMFESDFLEGQTRCIVITDFTADTIKSMLDFFYRASVDELDVDKALDLLRAADKYDVPDLSTYCCEFLLGHINVKNVIPILVSADMFGIPYLKKRALDYFTKKKSSICIDEHKSLLDTRPSVLYEIINLWQRL